MKKIISWWKKSPRVRFAARTVGVAIAGYIAPFVYSGDYADWKNIISGATTAGISALFGYLGLEPFVGVNKPKNIAVPVPPAVKEEG
jgi:hypothetical protein